MAEMINSLNKHQIGGYTYLSIVALVLICSYATLSFNMAPILIGMFVQDFGTSESAAGRVISAELVSLAITVILLSVKIDKLPSKRLISYAVIALTIANIASALTLNLHIIVVIRSFAGLASGIIVCACYYIVGTSKQPVRLFGLLTFGNVLLSIIFFTLLPVVIKQWHYPGVFFAMACPFILVVFFLSKVPKAITHSQPKKVISTPIMNWQAWMFVVAVFMVQLTEGGYFAYVELIGKQLSVSTQTIGLALAASYGLSLIGSSVASYIGDRFGIMKPMFIGMLGHALSVWFVVFSNSETSYLVPLLLQSFFLFIFLPYMLGAASNLDSSGRLSSLTGGVVLLGMGSGPIILGSSIESLGYSTIAYSVVLTVVLGYLLLIVATRHSNN